LETSSSFFFSLVQIIVISRRDYLFSPYANTDKAKKKRTFFSSFPEPDKAGGENYEDSETDGSIISETDTRATFSVWKIIFVYLK